MLKKEGHGSEKSVGHNRILQENSTSSSSPVSVPNCWEIWVSLFIFNLGFLCVPIFDLFRNKRVCIDLSCWIVQLHNVNKTYCGNQEKVYLKCLFHRLRALIALNCSIIFVTGMQFLSDRILSIVLIDIGLRSVFFR